MNNISARGEDRGCAASMDAHDVLALMQASTLEYF